MSSENPKDSSTKTPNSSPSPSPSPPQSPSSTLPQFSSSSPDPCSSICPEPPSPPPSPPNLHQQQNLQKAQQEASDHEIAWILSNELKIRAHPPIPRRQQNPAESQLQENPQVQEQGKNPQEAQQEEESDPDTVLRLRKDMERRAHPPIPRVRHLQIPQLQLGGITTQAQDDEDRDIQRALWLSLQPEQHQDPDEDHNIYQPAPISSHAPPNVRHHPVRNVQPRSLVFDSSYFGDNEDEDSLAAANAELDEFYATQVTQHNREITPTAEEGVLEEFYASRATQHNRRVTPTEEEGGLEEFYASRATQHNRIVTPANDNPIAVENVGLDASRVIQYYRRRPRQPVRTGESEAFADVGTRRPILPGFQIRERQAHASAVTSKDVKESPIKKPKKIEAFQKAKEAKSSSEEESENGKEGFILFTRTENVEEDNILTLRLLQTFRTGGGPFKYILNQASTADATPNPLPIFFNSQLHEDEKPVTEEEVNIKLENLWFEYLKVEILHKQTPNFDQDMSKPYYEREMFRLLRLVFEPLRGPEVAFHPKAAAAADVDLEPVVNVQLEGAIEAVQGQADGNQPDMDVDQEVNVQAEANINEEMKVDQEANVQAESNVHQEMNVYWEVNVQAEANINQEMNVDQEVNVQAEANVNEEMNVDQQEDDDPAE